MCCAVILGKRSREANEEEDEYEKKRRIIEEIEASLPTDMSKNQRKKQVKMQFRDMMKSEWRARKKEKDKEKRRRQKEDTPQELVSFNKKIKSMSSDEASQMCVVIDLGYEHLMNDKDIKMLMKQCQRCYSQNRRATRPLQLYFTSFKGKCKKRLDEYVQGYQNWDVHLKQEHYLNVFDKQKLVFLAAESPNILTELSSDKVYIIGGLVDHNHHKGYCYSQAIENGISHAQLPISDYITLNSRRILTVTHVFEILLAYEEYKDWKKAFYEAIPSRKVVKSDNKILTPSNERLEEVTQQREDNGRVKEVTQERDDNGRVEEVTQQREDNGRVEEVTQERDDNGRVEEVTQERDDNGRVEEVTQQREDNGRVEEVTQQREDNGRVEEVTQERDDNGRVEEVAKGEKKMNSDTTE